MSEQAFKLKADERVSGRVRARRKTNGFTLIELLVVVAIIALLIAILVPSLAAARVKAQRVRCSANLHAMGIALVAYASNESNHGLPRTTYRVGQHMQLDNAGYLVPDSFGNSGYVGDNNVPASMFLLMKTENLPTKLFVCPSTQARPGFTTGANTDIQKSSNWELIPDHLSYSMAAPYPDVAGAG